MLVSIITNAQDFLTVPDVFNKQCKTSFIKSIGNGTKSLEGLSSKSQRYWVVYSDRGDNQFYSNHHSSSKNNLKASFMQGFYVKNTNGNWLHLFEMIDETDMGWMKADKLLLSNYSLITEGDINRGEISIPRKAIILTSIDHAKSSGNFDKKYFSHPSSKDKKFNNGIPKKFQSLFIFKESEGSVLLGVSDVLGSGGTNKSSKIHGWISKTDIKSWDTRVALENANSKVAHGTYGKVKFNGYATLKELNLCLEKQKCSSSSNLVEIKIGPTRNNEMRRPILQNINENIFKVVSVLGSKKGSKKLEAKLEKSRKLQEKVNIVFVLDATASMRPYYKSIANSIEKVIDNNQKIINSSLKVGVVIYRDYLDGKDSYDVFPLSTNYEKAKSYINRTRCHSKDLDLPEAQYNGIINGLSKVGFQKGESNIIVIIGDCGNHLEDQKNYDRSSVVKVLDKFKVNIISFQVDSKRDYSFFQFNKDVFYYINESAKKRVAGSEIKTQYKESEENTIKLLMKKEGEKDYENMFGVFVYSNGETSSPELLESTIEKTLTDYMKTIENNINILSQYVYKGGPVGSEPPPGVIKALMDQLNCTKAQADDYLKRTELTAEAYVALDYNGSNVPTQIPVVLLTNSEKNKLTKSLKKLTEGVFGTTQKRVEFQKNIIHVCKSIIGQSTSTELIENLTMNQIWNLILGVDFGHKKIKKLRLSELETELSRRQFKKFYNEFETVAKDFCDNSYVHSDDFKSRRFSVAGSYLYWIPLNDLPGCKVE